MTAIEIVFLGILLLLALYLFCIAPGRDRRGRMRLFEERYIAHRGLFDNSGGAPENSIPAFRRAVEAGYGIELDIQLTTDGTLVVFHDENLMRMCGADRILTKCSFDELKRYKLADSKETIPLFEEVLDLISGRVPLIVEIKSEGDWKSTAKQAAEVLDSYKGCYCIESFHPFAVAWFKKNRPEMLRGQLSTDYFKDKIERNWFEKFLLTNLMLNFMSRPDFIAYNHLWSDQFSFKLCRKLFSVEKAAWTIKSRQEMDDANEVYDIQIFDGFIPPKPPQKHRKRSEKTNSKNN